MSSPLQRENVTSDSERQHHFSTQPSPTTSTTTTTTIPRNLRRKTETTSLSPEDWLEQFYNGKNLLRSKQIKNQMNKDKGKFDNFPRVQDNIVTQAKNDHKTNLFLKPLIVFSKDDIFEEERTTDLRMITITTTTATVSPSPKFTSSQPISQKKIKFGTKLSSVDVNRQPDQFENATSSVKLNENIRNRLNIMVKNNLKGTP